METHILGNRLFPSHGLICHIIIIIIITIIIMVL
jgi:hypothetical protein